MITTNEVAENKMIEMLPKTIAETGAIAQGFDNPYALAALLIIAVVVVIIVSLGVYAKHERDKTSERGAKRDEQMAELKGDIKLATEKAEGVGKSLDKHVAHHKDVDSRTQRTVDNIDGRLRKIEDNLIERARFDKMYDDINGVKIDVAKIAVIIEERFRQ